MMPKRSVKCVGRSFELSIAMDLRYFSLVHKVFNQKLVSLDT